MTAIYQSCEHRSPVPNGGRVVGLLFGERYVNHDGLCKSDRTPTYGGPKKVMSE